MQPLSSHHLCPIFAVVQEIILQVKQWNTPLLTYHYLNTGVVLLQHSKFLNCPISPDHTFLQTFFSWQSLGRTSNHKCFILEWRTTIFTNTIQNEAVPNYRQFQYFSWPVPFETRINQTIYLCKCCHGLSPTGYLYSLFSSDALLFLLNGSSRIIYTSSRASTRSIFPVSSTCLSL